MVSRIHPEEKCKQIDEKLADFGCATPKELVQMIEDPDLEAAISELLNGFGPATVHKILTSSPGIQQRPHQRPAAQEAVPAKAAVGEAAAAKAAQEAAAAAEVAQEEALTASIHLASSIIHVKYLLQEWLGSTPKLDEYATTLLENGYDTPEMLDEPTSPDDLVKLGFAKSHANKVVKCVAERSQPSSPPYSPVSASDKDRVIGTNLRVFSNELGRGAHGLVSTGTAKC